MNIAPCIKPPETAYVGTTFDSFRTDTYYYTQGHPLGPQLFTKECNAWLVLQNEAMAQRDPETEEVCAYFYDMLSDYRAIQYAAETAAQPTEREAIYLGMAHTLALTKLARLALVSSKGMRINHNPVDSAVSGIHLAIETIQGREHSWQAGRPEFFETEELVVQGVWPAILQPSEVAGIIERKESFDTADFVTLTPRIKTQAWQHGYTGLNAQMN